MALQNGTNPIVFDAAGQSVGRCKISCLVWSGIATAGHDLLINVSSGGNIVFEGKQPANASLIIPNIGWVDGLYITTIDSGKVMVYLSD